MMELKPYVRRAMYYETDQMGVVHHTNYIRWFEESRVDLLRQCGIDYREMETRGIIIPVVDMQCSYLTSVRFDDVVEIHLTLTKYTGVRMCFSYEVRFAESGILAATGKSTHCFVDPSGKPIGLKRVDAELHERFAGMAVSE